MATVSRRLSGAFVALVIVTSACGVSSNNDTTINAVDTTAASATTSSDSNQPSGVDLDPERLSGFFDGTLTEEFGRTGCTLTELFCSM